MPNKLNFLPLADKPFEKKWGFIYAYNLHTIRDIFVFIYQNKFIKEKDLYNLMDKFVIAPPNKMRWENPNSKKKDRIKIEYIHAARYLNLIDFKNGSLSINDEDFKKEKEIILKENEKRVFLNSKNSPDLKDSEKRALLSIILSYIKAKEYLWWYLDFEKFKSIEDFGVKDFKTDASGIYNIKKILKGEKAGDFIKREIDNSIWLVPSSKEKDYRRLVSFVFPRWFKDLDLIDKIFVYKEFSFDENSWEYCYPIKRNKLKYSDFERFLKIKFFDKNKKDKIIWIPELIYSIVKEYNCKVKTVKDFLIKLHKEKPNKYNMERSSLQVMKYKEKKLTSKYFDESVIKFNGFYRSYFKIKF